MSSRQKVVESEAEERSAFESLKLRYGGGGGGGARL